MAGSSLRGFAAMDRRKQREIASKGGQSVPPENRSFSRDHSLAAAAGRKGGENSHGGGQRRRQTSQGGDGQVRRSEAGNDTAAASLGK